MGGDGIEDEGPLSTGDLQEMKWSRDGSGILCYANPTP